MNNKLNRDEYYSLLNEIQNQMPHVDIISFTGMLDDAEKLAHLFHYMWQVELKTN